MFGPRLDRPGCCNAVLAIGDDYGDNQATMRCQREPGHQGRHAERWRAGEDNWAEVTWDKDERDEVSPDENPPSATPPHEAPSGHPPPSHIGDPPASHGEASDPSGATPGPPLTE